MSSSVSSTFPSFLPPAVAQLTEPSSVQMAQAIRQAAIATPLADAPIPSTYVCGGGSGAAEAPVVMIHGFDSSLLEFRRLWPLLTPHRQAWAVDLLGFGFCDRTRVPLLTPGAIKLHLHSFWQQQIRQPMVLVGASMGGAAAIDFALTYPDAVEKLVLLDSAGFAAGPAMGRVMVPPLDKWATAFLRNPKVRRRISLQAYCDRSLVTPDAECCASLHLGCDRWQEGLIAFTKSNGYNFLSGKIAQVSQPTLVLWGTQDKILGTKDAARFAKTLPNNQLVWVDKSGHVPHLEQPEVVAEAILQFLPRELNR